MNNEPVAWMLTLPDGTHDWILDGNECEGYIPLYTHPAKELTDEEIIDQANHLADGWFSDKFEKGIFITEEKIVDLVKTILRKAQEK